MPHCHREALDDVKVRQQAGNATDPLHAGPLLRFQPGFYCPAVLKMLLMRPIPGVRSENSGPLLSPLRRRLCVSEEIRPVSAPLVLAAGKPALAAAQVGHDADMLQQRISRHEVGRHQAQEEVMLHDLLSVAVE